MAPPRRVSMMQLEELLMWMESHPRIAKTTRFGGPQKRHQANKLYEELALRLNAVGDGASKTPKEWREYWTDLKYKVRKKGAHCRQSGGDPADLDIFTQIEERICNLMEAPSHPTSPIPTQTLIQNHTIKGPVDSPGEEMIHLAKRKHFTEIPVDETMEEENKLLGIEDHTIKSPVDSPVEEMIHLDGPPRWALDLEERRFREERTRRRLEERRLALEETRLQEECAFRTQLLAVLNRIADSLAATPQ